jgi:hypothetical protein
MLPDESVARPCLVSDTIPTNADQSASRMNIVMPSILVPIMRSDNNGLAWKKTTNNERRKRMAEHATA